MVTHQSELQRRHERVSALACNAAQGQVADEKRLAAAKAKRMAAHAVAHLDTDEDHGDDDAASIAPPTAKIAQRRAAPTHPQ